MRDFATKEQLMVLSNMEAINAMLIEARYMKLRTEAERLF